MNRNYTSLSVSLTLAQRNILVHKAKIRGMSTSAYLRALLADRLLIGPPALCSECARLRELQADREAQTVMDSTPDNT